MRQLYYKWVQVLENRTRIITKKGNFVQFTTAWGSRYCNIGHVLQKGKTSLQGGVDITK